MFALMKVAVGVAREITEERAVVVKRAKLAGVVLSRVIRRKVDDDFDSIRVRCADEIVKLGPRITRVAKVFLDAFEVARLVTVIRSGRIAATVGNVCVEIIDGGRDPDGGHAETGEIRHLLLNTGEIAAPVSTPVGFG